MFDPVSRTSRNQSVKLPGIQAPSPAAGLLFPVVSPMSSEPGRPSN